jgi:hypothetical protein
MVYIPNANNMIGQYTTGGFDVRQKGPSVLLGNNQKVLRTPIS